MKSKIIFLAIVLMNIQIGLSQEVKDSTSTTVDSLNINKAPVLEAAVAAAALSADEYAGDTIAINATEFGLLSFG